MRKRAEHTHFLCVVLVLAHVVCVCVCVCVREREREGLGFRSVIIPPLPLFMTVQKVC